MSRVPDLVVEQVLERACGYCEACGWPELAKMDLHHRLPRSHGGHDETPNLIWVHHTCHVITPWSIHQNPRRSYRLGHMLRTLEDPAARTAEVSLDLRVLRS